MTHGTKTLVLVRHGDYSGQKLTGAGREESRALAEKLQDQGYLDPDTIILSSPQARAQETAAIIAEHTNSVTAIETHPFLDVAHGTDVNERLDLDRLREFRSYLDMIKGLSDDSAVAVLVTHQPNIMGLSALFGIGDRKYANPDQTASAVAYEIPVDRWADIITHEARYNARVDFSHRADFELFVGFNDPTPAAQNPVPETPTAPRADRAPDNLTLKAVTFEIDEKSTGTIEDTENLQKYVVGPTAAIAALLRSCISRESDMYDSVLVRAFMSEEIIRPLFIRSTSMSNFVGPYGRITLHVGEPGSSGIQITPDELKLLGNNISALFDGKPVELVTQVFQSVRLSAPEMRPRRTPAPAPSGGLDDFEDDIPF